MNFALLVLKSILAGVCISIGGTLFVASKYVFNLYASEYSNFGTIIGSFLFSVGLLLVCKCKMMLYTGKIGLAFEERKKLDYWIEIITMIVLNVGSAWGFGRLVRFIIDKTKFNTVIATIETIATNKLVMKNKVSEIVNNYVIVIFQSIFCGSCVHMAVRSFNYLTNIGNVVLLVWFVFMFVFGGFQHCIANSYYFGLDNLYSKEAIINIVVCIVGNMIGTIPIAQLTKIFNEQTTSRSTSISEQIEEHSISSSSSSSSATIEYGRQRVNV